MSKTVIVYNHPYEGSFCHGLLESCQMAVQQAGREVAIIDLDKDGFNPVMTSQDLHDFVQKNPIDEQAIAYGKRLEEADHIIFIFPIWWELMPAMMKGFIDKVVFPGIMYDYGKLAHEMKTTFTPETKITILTTMNTPKWYYGLAYRNAIQSAMVKGTFKKIGFKNVKCQTFNQVKTTSPNKRQTWLEKAAQLAVRLYRKSKKVFVLL